MRISVVIPTLNEEAVIGLLIKHLWQAQNGAVSEIIVSDGGSSDATKKEVLDAGGFFFESPAKGRAAQLNFGAEQAGGEVLYFLHADVFPPTGFDEDILEKIRNGFQFGNFRQKIASANRWVNINSWASRSERLICSGGDQSLFITRELFKKLEGYRSDFQLMEDYDLFIRASKFEEPVKIKRSLKVIDRKYECNNYLKVNFCNGVIFGLYRLGVHPNKLKPLYKKWIKGPRYNSLPK